MSILASHFVSSPRGREKRDRRDSRRDEREEQGRKRNRNESGDEREEQGRKRNRNESEETEEIKTFPHLPLPATNSADPDQLASSEAN